VGQPTAENPKGREPLILKESQKEVDPLFYEKRAKNTDLGWKGQKECDKISCRRITYKELKPANATLFQFHFLVEELPIRN